jgi:integrase/recombinase XerD
VSPLYNPQRRPKQARPILQGDDPLGLDHLARQYLDWLTVRNFSATTLEAKGRCLHYFARWCEERGVGKPTDVTLPLIERYQRHLFHYRTKVGKPLTIHSQRSRLAVLRPFFAWLVRERHLLANPASELIIPRKITNLPRDILSAEEAERVLAQPDLTSPLGVRDRAILELLYSTGIRRFELLGLKLYELDLSKGTLFVRQGKGAKDRVVPLGERAQAWLEKYLAEVRPQLVIEPDDQTVFVTAYGDAYSPNGLTQLARFYVRASGVGKAGACHLFRHTAATLMLEGGADVRFIQELLGHSEIETTQIYTHVTIDRLQHVHRLTHPGALLKRRKDGESDEETLLEDLYATFAAEAAEEGEEATPPATSPTSSHRRRQPQRYRRKDG